MKSLLKKLAPFVDIISLPFTFIGGIFFRLVRKFGISRLPLTRKLLFSIGMFPIVNHYYDPVFNPQNLKHSLRDDRNLPGIDFNESKQLDLLNSFNYQEELIAFPVNKPSGTKPEYYYNCGAYCAGDGEFLYSMVRNFKPSRIIEIGSGFSSLMILNSLNKNRSEDENYTCIQECIEPYEMPWLESLPVQVIRKKLEDVDINLFSNLKANDMLIIDSSHIIRPQGDVVTEYLEILPALNSGVIVHIHDIFTPKDYLDSWFYKDVHFWNEQYLLEAFLTLNKDFEIIGALNYLKHKHFDLFAEKCPILKQQPNAEPGAFWIRRI